MCRLQGKFILRVFTGMCYVLIIVFGVYIIRISLSLCVAFSNFSSMYFACSLSMFFVFSCILLLCLGILVLLVL